MCSGIACLGGPLGRTRSIPSKIWEIVRPSAPKYWESGKLRPAALGASWSFVSLVGFTWMGSWNWPAITLFFSQGKNLFLTPVNDWIHDWIWDWTQRWDPAFMTSTVWPNNHQGIIDMLSGKFTIIYMCSKSKWEIHMNFCTNYGAFLACKNLAKTENLEKSFYRPIYHPLGNLTLKY